MRKRRRRLAAFASGNVRGAVADLLCVQPHVWQHPWRFIILIVRLGPIKDVVFEKIVHVLELRAPAFTRHSSGVHRRSSGVPQAWLRP
jgi:hypothetical protein